MSKPKTLQQAIVHFSNPDNCVAFMIRMRWPKGVECPTCGRKDVVYLANQRKWQCKSVHDHRQFSAKVGSIFEDSPISLDKWLMALWMIANCKNGVSSYEVHRALGVTQKTAWFMLHRIRLAMQSHSLMKMGGTGGEVEVDETFIGGKARNMHPDKRKRRIHVRGTGDKAVVMGMLDRDTRQVRAMTVPDVKRPTLWGEVKKHVEPGTAVYTDYLPSYFGLDQQGFAHEMVDHAERYVDGKIHTNGLENFWSLLKRGLKGTYVAIEPFHLFRYVDEQAFRYNNRGSKDAPVNDGDRFEMLASHIVGKRLTYAELTGKVGATPN